jgi:hypothetical protein
LLLGVGLAFIRDHLTTATEATTADQRYTSTASGLAKGSAGGIGRFSRLMKTARPEPRRGRKFRNPKSRHPSTPPWTLPGRLT